MSIIDIFFPRKCLGCGSFGNYFCADCLNKLKIDNNRICPQCEKPSIGGLVHPRCKTTTSLDGLTSIFNYQGLIKKAISKLKYQFVEDLSSDLAELILSFLGEDKTFVAFCRNYPIFVPIPVHKKRENWRGFNQARTIGEFITDNLGLKIENKLLSRSINTKSQMMLKGKLRIENIKGAFMVDQVNPTPQNIILFDDVYTTGSTLREACKTMKKAGASSVWALTLAK